MKKFFALAVLAAIMLASCGNDVPVEPDGEGNKTEIPADYEPLKLSVPVTDNWIYEGQPEITITAQNPNDGEMPAEVKVYFYTDQKKQLDIVEFTDSVPAKQKKNLVVKPTVTLEPGFYKATCAVNGKIARSFIFGVKPSEIVSAPDMQPDFNEFWDATIAELEALDMNATLTEIPSKSSSARKVYQIGRAHV